MMCRWNSQITSDCWPTAPYPSHPPPPCSGAPPPYHTLSLITALFVASHLVTPGVFHENFLWYKLLALICVTTLPFVFTLGMTFCTYTQHFIAKKCTLCRTVIWRNPYPALLLLLLPFKKFMPITYFVGIKCPLILLEHRPRLLWGKGSCVNDYQQRFTTLLTGPCKFNI